MPEQQNLPQGVNSDARHSAVVVASDDTLNNTMNDSGNNKSDDVTFVHHKHGAEEGGKQKRKSCIINGNVGVEKSSIHIMSGGRVEGGSVVVNGDMSREAFMELFRPK
ncbi:hypothetical protein RU639_013136 [Aspergillus parasiticus]